MFDFLNDLHIHFMSDLFFFSFLGLCFYRICNVGSQNCRFNLHNLSDVYWFWILVSLIFVKKWFFFITRLWFGTLFLKSWGFFFFLFGWVICGNWLWSQLMIWVRDWLIIRRFRYHMLTNCWKKGFKVWSIRNSRWVFDWVQGYGVLEILGGFSCA